MRTLTSQIESPKGGDDTRSWLPPFAPIPQPADALAEGSTGEAVTVPRPDLPPESAYFLQANRNKRSYVLLSVSASMGRDGRGSPERSAGLCRTS